MRKEKLEIFQEFINKQRAFKIEGYENTYTNLEDFIYNFQLGELVNRKNIFLDDGSVMRKGWRRSLIDVILASKYHHNATIEDVLNVYKEAKQKNGILRGRYCADIGRLIMWTKKEEYINLPGRTDTSWLPDYITFFSPNPPVDMYCQQVRYNDLFEDNTEG